MKIFNRYYFFSEWHRAKEGILILPLLMLSINLCIAQTVITDGTTINVTGGVYVANNGVKINSGATMKITGGSASFKNEGVSNIYGRLEFVDAAFFTPSGVQSLIYNNGSLLLYSGTQAKTAGQEIPPGAKGIPEGSTVEVVNSGGVTLSETITVTGTLKLSKGNVTLGNYDLLLSNPYGLTGGSSLSYIITNGSGMFKRAIADAADYYFPVGSSSAFNPARISWTASPGISRLDAIYHSFTANNNAGLNVQVGNLNLTDLLNNGYWTFNKTGTLINNFDISVTRSGHNNAAGNLNLHGLVKRISSSDLWESAGNWIQPPSVSLSAADPVSISQTNVADFGDIAAGFGFNCIHLSIINRSTNTTVCEGGDVAFFADVSGTKPFSYQWTRSGSEIQGATGSVFSINNVNLSNADVYSCNIRNNCSSVNIKPFLLEVKAKPSINISPVTQIKFIGDSLTYSLSPSGTPPYGYQWLKNNILIEGATGNTFKIKPIACNDAGVYSCIISNGCGSTTSKVGTLLVNGCGGISISGRVLYDNKFLKPMNNVTNTIVFLETNEGIKTDSSYADLNGEYNFINVAVGNYRLVSSTKYKWGGGNPLDALLVNRHYVGTYLFGDALKTQAADVDLSEKINPADALAINRRYVGLINRFRAPDWIFEIPEISVGGNDINLDIKSICSGDVDGTYTW